MNKKEIENATLEAIYWWNRDEYYYHSYFSKLDKIYSDKKLLEFFTTKIFEIFLREYSVRRNISAGYENVDKFIDELFSNDFFKNVQMGNIEIVDELSNTLRELGDSTPRQTKSLMSKVAFLINPNDFAPYDNLAKQSLWNIYKDKNQIRLADLEFYSKFTKQIDNYRIELQKNLLFAESKTILKQFENTEAYKFFSTNEKAFEIRIIDKHLWLMAQSQDSRKIENSEYIKFQKIR